MAVSREEAFKILGLEEGKQPIYIISSTIIYMLSMKY